VCEWVRVRVRVRVGVRVRPATWVCEWALWDNTHFSLSSLSFKYSENTCFPQPNALFSLSLSLSLPLISILGGSLYFNFAMGSVSEVPATLIGAYLVDKIGRRKTLSGGYLLGGLACTFCVVLAPGSDGQKYTAMLGKFGITAAFSCIFVYAAELFPTVLRSAGMGMSSTAARVGGMAAPTDTYYHIRTHNPRFYSLLIQVSLLPWLSP